MITAHQRLNWCIVALMTLFPAMARAQTVAHSFDELQHSLRVGQKVVLIDDNGKKTTGTVGKLSSSAITVGTSVFQAAAVKELRVSDRLWNGVAIGAAIGTGFATWDYAIDPSEPGNAAVFTAAIGLGSAIGAGIDARTKGKLLYKSAQQHATVAVLPLFGRITRGVLVAVHF